MENFPSIVDLLKMVIFHSYVKLPQGDGNYPVNEYYLTQSCREIFQHHGAYGFFVDPGKNFGMPGGCGRAGCIASTMAGESMGIL